jgi:hypothetical protein
MGTIAGVQHLHAVRAFEKLGYRIVRESKHIIMTNGVNQLTIPRNNPINPITMGVIVKGAGLTVEDFRKLL